MSEFKFVQWGKGTPVDYQRLNAMMLNEQYLKDVVDLAPRGVLLWKQSSSVTINPTGGLDSITNFTNLVFEVEEDRLVTFQFEVGTIPSAIPSGFAQVEYGLIIDGAGSAAKQAGGYYVYDGRGPSSTLMYVTPEALSKGTHTVSLVMIANGSLDSVQLGTGGSGPLFIVRDEGKFISASS